MRRSFVVPRAGGNRGTIPRYMDLEKAAAAGCSFLYLNVCFLIEFLAGNSVRGNGVWALRKWDNFSRLAALGAYINVVREAAAKKLFVGAKSIWF